MKTRLRLVATGATAAALILGLAPPTGAATADRTRPVVAFATPRDAVLVGVPAAADAAGQERLTHVRGTASDRRSGIRRVDVVFCRGHVERHGGWTCTWIPESTRVTLSCSSTRRTCTWAAAAPLMPGRYLAFASAADRAGNEGWPPDPLPIVVA